MAEVVADGIGNLTGIEDVSQPTPGNPSQITVSTVPLVANYTQVVTNGLITAAVSTAGTGIQGVALYSGFSQQGSGSWPVTNRRERNHRGAVNCRDSAGYRCASTVSSFGSAASGWNSGESDTGLRNGSPSAPKSLKWPRSGVL